eukprot:Skav222107  [mRNA]  locus=scaffold1181:160132:182182:- [translate_table: standard]
MSSGDAKGTTRQAKMKMVEGKAGVMITASASLVLALHSSIESVLPVDDNTSVMVFFARPVLGFAVAAMLFPLLQRSERSAVSISALGLAMSAPLALVPKSLLSYHWAALAGAFIKVPLLCTLLHGDPTWAGWRVAGAFYGVLLGPTVISLNLPEESLRVMLALCALSVSTLHFATANQWVSQAARKMPEQVVEQVPLPIPPWSSLAGVTLAWLLLSVQLALLPLLHALHGHRHAASDHHLALGAALLLASLFLRKSSPKTLMLALCLAAAACALTMREVAQALGAYHLWQLQGFSWVSQLSLGVLLASALQIGRLSTCAADAAVLGCALAAAAFVGEGLGLVLQLLLLPALGALGTMKAIALVPLCYAFWSLRHCAACPTVVHGHEMLCSDE